MSESPDEIQQLLRQAQAAEPVVGEFAAVWLETFRRDTRAVLEWQWRDGRVIVWAGGDPEMVRAEAERREQARSLLRDRLARLVGWAKDSGRLGD